MRRILGVVGAVVALAGVAACGGPESVTGAPVAVSVSPSVPVSSNPAAATTATKAAQDPLTACRGFIGDGGDQTLLSRVPVVLAKAEAQLTRTQLDEMLAINNQLTGLAATAPVDVAVPLLRVQGPFKQVATAYEGGAGSVTIHASDVQPAVTDLVTACNRRGYQAH